MIGNKILGNLGEDLACDFLIKKGYKILERNFVWRKNEIDIIAEDEKERNVVFIEVKTRNTDYFIQPFEAVDFKKQKAIIKVANAYIRNRNLDLEARFDVISIIQTELKPWSTLLVLLNLIVLFNIVLLYLENPMSLHHRHISLLPELFPHQD